MKPKTRPAAKPRSADPQSVFCEVCMKRVPLSQALVAEGKDFTARFCSDTCYGRWRGKRAPAPPPHELQEGAGRSISRDERVKRATRRDPQRDEPRADSVERDDLPE
jgi:hypothetical protein